MPVIVPCPKCGTPLTAPDSAAGKRIRCPRPGCGAITLVPEFITAEAVEVVESTVVSPPAKPQPVDKSDSDRVRKTTARVARARDNDNDNDEDEPRVRRRADNASSRPRQKRKRSGNGIGTTAIVALALGGFLIFVTIGIVIYAVNRTRDETKNGGSGGDSSGSNTSGSSSKSKRPKGSRMAENGQGLDDPNVVDAAWSKLLGKWEILPNPDLKATCEFNKDYSITHSMTPKNGQEERSRKVVAAILDSSVFHRGLNNPWLTIGPNDRYYQVTYETPQFVHESSFCIVFADGTIAASGESRYHRLGETGPDGTKNPTLEETLWMLLAGRQFGRDTFNWVENIEFRKDKTLYWKTVADRKQTTIIEGQVSGVRVTPTGFVILLGKHTNNGRSQPSGETPEFYYLGKCFYVKRSEKGYGILDPK